MTAHIAKTTSSIRRDPFAARGRASLIAMVAALATAALPASPASAEEEDSFTLEEIIVSARFREEKLQQTPLAITALTMETLEVKNFTNIEDIGGTIPNAFIRPGHSAFAGAPTIQIRGVGQTDFLYAFEPGVGVYIDDVYHATLLGSSLDLMDLERVEVLRGPQGTLFGKNSLGGAVRIVSKKPEGDGTGSLEATYGSLDRLEFKGSYDFSLVEDKLFLRLSGASKHRDGYQDQLDFTCQMIANGTPQLAGIGDGIGADGSDAGTAPDAVAVGSAADNAFYFPERSPSGSDDCVVGQRGAQTLDAARLMLRYAGGNGFEALITADYSDDRQTSAPNSLLYRRTTTGTYNTGAIYPRYGIRTDLDDRFVTGLDTAFGAANPYITYGTFADPLTGESWPNVTNIEGWGVSGAVDYDFGEAVHLKFVTAYRTYEAESNRDSDETPFGYNIIYNLMTHEQLSAELQLSGALLGDRLEWTVGAFYFDANQHLGGRVHLGDQAFLGRIPPFDQNDAFDVENKSAFVHLVFDVTDRLSVTGGLRYTDESKAYHFDHGVFLRLAAPALASLSRFDWKVSVDYKLTDELFLYGQASTGFRSPGFNPRPFTQIQFLPFDSESLTAYELGFKGDLLDNRVRLNLAGFYSDYARRVVSGSGGRQCYPDNVAQQPYFVSCPSDSPYGASGIQWPTYFVAPAEVYGLEAEFSATPFAGATIDGMVGRNWFKGKVGPTAQGYRHPDALVQPNWTASAGVQYEILLGNLGSLTPRIDWFYQSKMTAGPVVRAPLPEDIIPAYSTFNGRLAFESADRDWSLALSVTNLTDKFYWYNLFDNGPASGGGRTGQPSRPREWALTLKHKI